MKFRVTYPTGKTDETESSDCNTVEAFCNCHFGSTWEEAQASGARVEIVDADLPESLPRPEPLTEESTGVKKASKKK